ncbi:MAG: alkaline phosphatase family protein [Candidatus Rokubacteria bacterium]|nr:alkaline phosphatase family protein [Candidatus Rokubacteria bacterium]
MTHAKKVLVLGLDCATPQLVFDRWRDRLPTLGKLMREGVWGELRSCDPPITVPAWSSMMTSKSPGRLGFYGFRNRTDHSYKGLALANSLAVKEPTVWDHCSTAGRPVVLIGVPQTYPPKPVHGHMVTCFLTPSDQVQYTYPASFKSEVEGLVGTYRFDVEGFRSDDKPNILRQIYDMTEKRFRLARHALRTKPWDFFMMVEMGIDRIHHGFWKYMDPDHPKHVPGNPLEHAIRDYYVYLDSQIAELLALLDEDTAVLVVSDHGAKGMAGGICLNEWLIREGYLVLRDRPAQPAPLKPEMVDWPRTTAWGEGGYYGRLSLNVRGREPEGLVPPERYEAVRDELRARLGAIPDHLGRPLETRVVRPEDVYAEVNGIAPDLMIYFDDLRWRSVGSVGIGRVHTFDNDTGPDDANHAQHGIFILWNANGRQGGRRMDGRQLMDVAPTLLTLMGLEVPGEMEGGVFTG